MDALISRQDAIKAYCEHQCGKGMIRGECGCDDCGTIFDDIPSADVVEVVRCEKCCFAKPFNDVWFQPKRDTLWCSVFMEERETEWFCANGERRTDEQ